MGRKVLWNIWFRRPCRDERQQNHCNGNKLCYLGSKLLKNNCPASISWFWRKRVIPAPIRILFYGCFFRTDPHNTLCVFHVCPHLTRAHDNICLIVPLEESHLGAYLAAHDWRSSSSSAVRNWASADFGSELAFYTSCCITYGIAHDMHVMTCHDMSWRVMTCRDMPWHVMTCHDMSCMSWHVTTCHDMSWHVVTCHDTSWHVMTRHDMSWHVMTCHGMSWHVMTCHGMSWHVVMCHDMSWHELMEWMGECMNGWGRRREVPGAGSRERRAPDNIHAYMHIYKCNIVSSRHQN